MVRRLFLVALLSLSLTGCATLVKWLPTVLSVLSESALVLDGIESAGNNHFARNPDAEAMAKFRQYMNGARAALARSARLSKTPDGATKQEIDQALGDFQSNYSSLLELLGPLGVVAPADAGALNAPPTGPGPLLVPHPEALQL